MNHRDMKSDEQLRDHLELLRPVLPRDPHATALGRANFLAQAATLSLTVSQRNNHRHNGWINTLILAYQKKERIPRLNTLMAVVITITLLLGCGGTTVYAAQGSLPDEVLYPIKTWSEDVRLSLAGSSQGELDLTLGFTDRRVAEAVKLQTAAKSVPGGVVTRLQEELDTALQIAAGLDDPQMVQALEKIRLKAETQSQMMTTLMGGGSSQVDPALIRMQERLQEQVQLAAFGEVDPQGFRLQMHAQQRNRQNQPSQTPHPIQPGSNPPTPSVTPVPTGNRHGPGPGGSQATGTPGHYGPGGSDPSKTPQPTGGSYGPGAGAGQATGTPGGYGPGPNPSQTPQVGNPGSGQQNPPSTQQPGGSSSATAQATALPHPGGNPGGGQPTEPPGHGGGQP